MQPETTTFRLDLDDRGSAAAAWTRFNEQEREKILRLLQYLRGATYNERTLAAIRRGLSTDWTSLYFAVGAAAALSWITRDRIGHYVMVGLTESGLSAIRLAQNSTSDRLAL